MNLIAILLMWQPTERPILREREGRWIEACSLSSGERDREEVGEVCLLLLSRAKTTPKPTSTAAWFPSPLHLVSLFLHNSPLPPTIFPSATYGFITEHSRYHGPNPHYFPLQSGQTLVTFPYQ